MFRASCSDTPPIHTHINSPYHHPLFNTQPDSPFRGHDYLSLVSYDHCPWILGVRTAREGVYQTATRIVTPTPLETFFNRITYQLQPLGGFGLCTNVGQVTGHNEIQLDDSGPVVSRT